MGLDCWYWTILGQLMFRRCNQNHSFYVLCGNENGFIKPVCFLLLFKFRFQPKWKLELPWYMLFSIVNNHPIFSYRTISVILAMITIFIVGINCDLWYWKIISICQYSLILISSPTELPSFPFCCWSSATALGSFGPEKYWPSTLENTGSFSVGLP